MNILYSIEIASEPVYNLRKYLIRIMFTASLCLASSNKIVSGGAEQRVLTNLCRTRETRLMRIISKLASYQKAVDTCAYGGDLSLGGLK